MKIKNNVLSDSLTLTQPLRIVIVELETHVCGAQFGVSPLPNPRQRLDSLGHAQQDRAVTAGLFVSVQPSSPVPGLRSVWFAFFSVVVVVGAFCSQETWGLILLLSVTGRVTWGPTSFTSPLFCKIKTLDEYSRALEATVALPVMRSLKWERGAGRAPGCHTPHKVSFED